MRFKILLYLIISTAALCKAESQNGFIAHKGIIEIGNSPYLNSNTIKLQGECEFYWNQLLEPTDFNNPSTKLNPQYVKIPKSWTTYKIDGKKLPNKGFATYRLLIHKKGDPKQSIYGLKLSTIFSSYKLWVNGELLAEVGNVDRNTESSEAAFKYQDIPIVCHTADSSQTFEIIVQVSNYTHQRGGLHVPVYFGKYENLTADTRWMDILNLIIVGIIFLIGINHLSLFLLRREDRSNLYFSIVCLVMILRNITTGDRIITYVLPNLNWELLFKLDNLSGFGTIPLFALFIYDLFEKDFPKKLMRTYLYIGIAVSALVILTSANFYGKFRIVFELYVLLGGLYLTFGILLRAALKKRPYAIYTFIGMFILYSTAINDVLSSMGIIQTAYVAPYGLVIFMLLQSISINIKSARAINHNEILSTQLQHEKENLEKRIEERTTELKSQHAMVLSHQEKERLENWTNHGISLINETIAQNKDSVQNLCGHVLSTLIKYIDAKAGAFYIANTDNQVNLSLIADYGLSRETKAKNSEIPTDSGLIGASYTLRQTQLIENIPEDYLTINSGLGKADPKTILIVPLTYEDSVWGVMEIACFKQITTAEVHFAEKVAAITASSINLVKMNEQNIMLIRQFEEKSKEMQENQDRLRQNLEELEMMREQYEMLRGESIQNN